MKSEMKALTESFDWSKTSIGPKSHWQISLRTVVEMILNSPMPMHLSWGPERIQFYNDAYKKIIEEYHPVLGKSVYETWSEKTAEIKPLIDQVLEGKSLYHENYLGKLRRGGRLQPCNFTTSMSPVLDDQGKVAGVLNIMIETTQIFEYESVLEERQNLAEAEKKELFDILMQAPLPVTIVEGPPDYRYAFSNPAHDEMIGRQVQGKKFLEAFSLEEVGHVLPMLEKIFSDAQPFITREYPITLIDSQGRKTNKWFDIGLYPYRGLSNEVKGFFSVASDTTEAMEAKHRIEKALHVRDEFISIASHEFKTPVSSLKLQFQMMERNLKKGIPPTEESLKKVLNLSLRQIDGLARLIEDLLDATKANNERMNFLFKETDLAEVAANAINQVTNFLSDHETLLTTQIEERLLMKCDPFRIEQVMTNLLINASKYGNYKPISMAVKKENENVKIIVSDHGIGISEDNHQKIFERFERGNVTKNYAGLGLGLFITKHIVEAHHGEIHVESKPGQGSTFTVTLPLE